MFFSEIQENGGYDQLQRLREKVRCIKYYGQKVECENAFYNFNIEMIEDVTAKEHTFVSHANYEELHKAHGGYIPPINNPKLTRLIGVSDFATKRLNEYAEKIGIKLRATTCYNPLMLEPKEKVVRLVSASRLDDEVNGGARTIDLISALDKYCALHGTHYTFDIFSNPMRWNTDSPNVAIRKPRVDVRPFIANADYVVVVPNDKETYGYTLNEALGYGVPIVVTPLTILKELPITENERIILNYDCSNIDDVARQIFEKEVKSFIYEPPKDSWQNLLAKGKPTYEKEKKKLVLVKAIKNYTDLELGEYKSVKDEPYEVTLARAQYLQDIRGLVKIVKGV